MLVRSSGDCSLLCFVGLASGREKIVCWLRYKCCCCRGVVIIQVLVIVVEIEECATRDESFIAWTATMFRYLFLIDAPRSTQTPRLAFVARL